MTPITLLILGLHNLLQSCSGIPKAQPMIGIQQPVPERKFSFIVSIQDVRDTKRTGYPEATHLCTGALISRRNILTATHCLESDRRLMYLEGGRKVKNIEVLAGSSDLRACSTYYPDSWHSFESWAGRKGKAIESNENDVAIMTLITEVSEPHIVPALLSKKKYNEINGFQVLTAGWGKQADGHISPTMNSASLTILDTEQCEAIYKRMKGVEKANEKIYVCSKSNPPVILLEGESGGPIFYKDNKILGVNTGSTSGGALDQSQTVNVHTSIDPYRGFINSVKMRGKPSMSASLSYRT